jgi:hypothetical protein
MQTKMSSSTPMPTTVVELIQKGQQLKAEGNALVKQQQHKQAAGKYSKIFAYVSGLKPVQTPFSAFKVGGENAMTNAGREPPSAAELATIKALTTAANANLSLCFLAQEEWTKCAKYATRALDAETGDPAHAKALCEFALCFVCCLHRL